MDNDGKHKGHQYTEQYGIPFTQVPLDSNTKDLTDFCKVYGPVQTEELTQHLIYEQTGIGNFIRSYIPG
jgi:hypothetical protein